MLVFEHQLFLIWVEVFWIVLILANSCSILFLCKAAIFRPRVISTEKTACRLRRAKHRLLYSCFEKGCRNAKVHATIPKGNLGYDHFIYSHWSCLTNFLLYLQTYLYGESWHFLTFTSNAGGKESLNLFFPTVPFGLFACTYATFFGQPLSKQLYTDASETSSIISGTTWYQSLGKKKIIKHE